MQISDEMVESAFNVFSDRMMMQEEDREFIGRVLEAALSAQVQDVAGWQLIETAPKDWTNIILFDEERDPDVFEGYFSMEDGGRNCWMENQGAGAEPVNPTHWMPLPAAPAKQEGGE